MRQRSRRQRLKKYSICKFFFLSNHRQISFSHMSEVSMALKLGSFVCSYVNKSSSCTLVKDWKVGWNLSWLIVHYICSAKYLGTILAKTWLLGLTFFFYAQEINLYLTLNVIFFHVSWTDRCPSIKMQPNVQNTQNAILLLVDVSKLMHRIH